MLAKSLSAVDGSQLLNAPKMLTRAKRKKTGAPLCSIKKNNRRRYSNKIGRAPRTLCEHFFLSLTSSDGANFSRAWDSSEDLKVRKVRAIFESYQEKKLERMNWILSAPWVDRKV